MRVSNYILFYPYIFSTKENGQIKEYLYSFARNKKCYLERILIEIQDKDFIEKVRPYIPTSRGGASSNELVKIPQNLAYIGACAVFRYDLDGQYVRKEVGRYLRKCTPDTMLTYINGIEYIDTIVNTENIKSNFYYIDDMKPEIYKEICFLCKYNKENEIIEEGWIPSVIGNRIKSLFFEKYDINKHPNIKNEIFIEKGNKYVGYDSPLTNELDSYPIIIFPNKNTSIFPYRINPNSNTSLKGVTEDQFYIKLNETFKSNQQELYEIRNDIHLVFKDDRYPIVPDVAIIGKNPILNIRIDIEIDEPYDGQSKKPIHFINGRDEERNKLLVKNGWAVIRFAEYQIVHNCDECIFFICKILNKLSNISSVIEHVQTIPIIKRWTFEEAQKFANDKYREGYLNHDFSLKAISLYEKDDLIQNDNEKKHSISGIAIEKKVKGENVEKSKSQESFWHKLLKLFGL